MNDGNSKFNGQSPKGWTLDTLNTYLLSLISALENKMDLILEAQKNSVKSAFESSQRAIDKAEEGQKEYNSKSNEFRQSLDDSNKIKIDRTEVVGLFKNQDEKIERNRRDYENDRSELKKEIAGLRESRSEGSGKTEGIKNIGSVITIVTGAILFIISLIVFAINFLK